MADNTQTLGFAGVEEEISLDQLSPEYQEQLISSKVQLQKLIEEQRKEVTKEAAGLRADYKSSMPLIQVIFSAKLMGKYTL